MQKIFKSNDFQSYEFTLYDNLTIEEINYEDFKKYVYSRLTILRKIENKVYIHDPKLSKNDDIIGHFCLKLICVQSRWSIKWFVNLETLLFKQRLSENTSKMKTFFLEKIWPHLNATPNIEFNTKYDISYVNPILFNDNILFHFTTCSEILPKRSQKIKSGFFEPTTDVLISYMTELFRARLEKSMNDLYDQVTIDSDERLMKLNKEIFSMPESSTEQLTGDILEMIKAFPPCINGIIQSLKANKHLKYTDRQVLCLFFKDIGMSLNDTICFFKAHFKCTPEQFNKEYLYNIRHNYGLEGKRANYSCFPCTRIIGMSNDASCFGCPFVNNHDFVKSLSDLEDFSKDAVQSCANFGARLIGKEFEKLFISPADFFKIVSKEIIQKNE